MEPMSITGQVRFLMCSKLKFFRRGHSIASMTMIMPKKSLPRRAQTFSTSSRMAISFVAGMQPMGNIGAIDPNTYWQFVVQLLGGIHGKPETSDNFLEKLKELGETMAPAN